MENKKLNISSEGFCKGEKFVKCMFENRDLDCNISKCPLSKNKTRDVQKRIGKIISKFEKERDEKFNKFIKKLKEGCGKKIGIVCFCGVETNTRTKKRSRKYIVRYCESCKDWIKKIDKLAREELTK